MRQRDIAKANERPPWKNRGRMAPSSEGIRLVAVKNKA